MAKVIVILFALCAVANFVTTAEAATYYVTQNGGSDGNACVTDNPNSAKATINAGARCLNGGDTLIIKSGTYDELLDNIFPSGSAGNPTVIRSEVQYGAVVKPTTRSEIIMTLRQVHDITFDGIVIDGEHLTNVHHFTSYGPSSNISLINSIIRNGHDGGYPNSYPSTDHTDTGWYIANNKFLDIGADAQVPARTDGRQSYNLYYTAQNGIIENNEFVNSGGYGLHMYSSGDGVPGANNNIIRNNIFRDNGKSSMEAGVLFAAGGDNNLFHNNIIYGSGDYGMQVDGYGITAHNNKVYTKKPQVYENHLWITPLERIVVHATLNTWMFPSQEKSAKS